MTNNFTLAQLKLLRLRWAIARLRPDPGKIKRTAALLILLTMSFCAHAQERGVRRLMTVLPDLDQTVKGNTVKPGQDLIVAGSTANAKTIYEHLVYLHFGLEAVPENAVVDSVVLKLYLKPGNKDNLRQTLRVRDLSNTPSRKVEDWERIPFVPVGSNTPPAIGQTDVSSKDTSSSIDISINKSKLKSWLSQQGKSIWLLLASGNNEKIYYSTRSGVPSKQPKLVVYYHMPDAVWNQDWVQFRYNAQHTSQLAWSFNTTATRYTSSNVIAEEGSYMTSKAILTQGLLVVQYQGAASAHELRAYSQEGSLVSSVDIGGQGNQPVADRLGNIYFASGNQSAFSVYRLDGQFRKMAEQQFPHGAQIQGWTVPVIGFDGSLYFSTNKGIYAYSGYPDFKLKWEYHAVDDDKYGTVSLSEDEGNVYVSCSGNQQGNGMLVALSSIDGMPVWKKTGLPAFPNDLPVAAVKTGVLYFTFGLRTGAAISVVDARTGATKDQLSGGRVSVPLLTGNSVYVVKDDRLFCKKFTGADTAFHDLNIKDIRLNPAVAMSADLNGNIYLLSTEEHNQYLAMLPFETDKPVVIREEGNNWGNLTGDYMILTTGGDVITGNANRLIAIRASGVKAEGAVTIAQPAGGTTYKAQGEIVMQSEAQLNKGQPVIVQGTKAVIINNNFSVAHGATFTIKKTN